MDELVNRVTQLRKLVAPAGIDIQIEAEHVRFSSPLGSARLRLVRLYRPSTQDIEQSRRPDVLLVVTAPTRKALEAAAPANYLVLPDGACRVVTSGIVIVLDIPSTLAKVSHSVKLTGRTGIIVETLLLGGARRWSVRDLAHASQVSPTLAHRVLTRLEKEGLLLSEGNGPEKVRAVDNLRALAELWEHEERRPQTVLRGFLYGASLESLAHQIAEVYPEGAVGGVLAANLYKPTLTRVPPPLRVWVKNDFDPAPLLALGLERTEEGVNVEFVASKGNPWRVHREQEGLAKISPTRAWLEIAEMGGRVQELADALLLKLEEQR